MAKKYQLHGAFPSKAGDSAYEVAQKNGFKGTEQEWLASLVGPQGPQGLPGEDGSGGSGVHVGPVQPTDPNINVWINPDGEATPVEPGEDGGYYTPTVTQPEAGKMQINWTASQDDMPAVEAQSVVLPSGPPGDPGEDYVLTEDDKRDIAEMAAGIVKVPEGDSYALPVATPNALGGVKPVAKTDEMTQSVGVDEAGGLWTTAGGGGKYEEIVNFELTEDVVSVSIPIAEAEWTKMRNAKTVVVTYNIPLPSATPETNLKANLEFAFLANNISWARVCNFTLRDAIGNYASSNEGTMWMDIPKWTSHQYGFGRASYFEYGVGYKSAISNFSAVALFKSEYTFGSLVITPGNANIPIRAGSKFLVYVL